MIKEIVIAMVFAAAAQSAHAQVLARVGNVQITVQDFNRQYAEVKKQTINPPPPETFLNDLIRFEMGVQEAEKRKMQNEPAVRDEIRKDMYKGLLDKVIGAKVQHIQVSDADMRNFYAKNPEIRSSHILISVPPDATPEQIESARKRATEIYNEVKGSHRPFPELVKLYSDDNLSKGNGGDIGFQNRITVVPTFYNQLLKMHTGEIAGPIRTQFGFHIVKMTGRRSYQDADKAQIRAAVFNQKRQVFFDEYFKSIGSRYKVTKNEKLVKSLK